MLAIPNPMAQAPAIIANLNNPNKLNKKPPRLSGSNFLSTLVVGIVSKMFFSWFLNVKKLVACFFFMGWLLSVNEPLALVVGI
jgi:hypothetical protein